MNGKEIGTAGAHESAPAITIILALSILAVLTMSCSRSKTELPAKAPATAAETVRPPVPPPAQVDESFLKEQRARSESVKRELTGIKHSANGDTTEIKRVLLGRKGEVLGAMKRVRLDPALSQTAKDSLLRVLEAESMDLSKQLIAVQQ
jgi:hypothetical protein